jgi:ABC-2 type transport system permease protein
MIVFLFSTAFLGFIFPYNFFLEGYVTIRPFFSFVSWIFMVIIPAIAMRTFSEEKKSGTIELLLTKPITDFQIVLGKFFASFAFIIITILLSLIFVITISIIGPLDYGVIISTYFGLILLSGMYLSIGLFISSLTKEQIVAYILTFVIILPLVLLDYYLVYVSSTQVAIYSYLSPMSHFSNFLKGIIATRDIVYFVSVIAVMLLLTRASLESRKW